MGLLDDLVKLNFMRPMGEGIGVLARAQYEKNAASKVSPVLQSLVSGMFGQQAPTAVSGEQMPGDMQEPVVPNYTTPPPAPGISDPMTLVNSTGKALAQLAAMPDIAHSTTAQNAIGNIKILQEMGAEAYTKKAEGLMKTAEARNLQARAAEQEAETKFYDTKVSDISPSLFTKYFPYLSEAEKKNRSNMTFRQMLGISKGEEPYIQLAMEQLQYRVGMANANEKTEEFSRMMMAALGEEYQQSVPGNINELLKSNNIPKFAGELTKRAIARQERETGTKMTTEQKNAMYEDILKRVNAGFVSYGKKLDSDNIRTDAIAKQGQMTQRIEAVKAYMENQASMMKPVDPNIINNLLTGVGVDVEDDEATKLRKRLQQTP